MISSASASNSNNLTDRIRRTIARTEQPWLQNAWLEVEYRLDACRVANWSTCRAVLVALHNGALLIFVCL